MAFKNFNLHTPLTNADIEQLRSGDMVFLSGVIYGARDAAHSRFKEALATHQRLPFDPQGQVIYYVGPTPAQPGHPVGAAGPTTASRMDPYAPLLIECGLKGMIGKGMRSETVLSAIKTYGCVYFGAIEGTAALIARTIKSAKVIAYEELGPEAVYEFQVENFPLVVINDLHGGDLYKMGKQKYAAKN